MITMDESEVTNIVTGHLREKLRNDQFINVGEIGVGDTLWKCDILVKHRGEPVMGVECKGDSGIRMGVGQALSYRHILGTGAISAYDISKDNLDFISELPIYCFNVRDDRGYIEVVVESRPDPSIIKIGDYMDESNEMKNLRSKNDELLRENNNLHQEIEDIRQENLRISKYIINKENASLSVAGYFEPTGLSTQHNRNRFINQSSVKDYFDKNTSEMMFDQLNEIVYDIILRAGVRAKENGRSTVFPSDL